MIVLYDSSNVLEIELVGAINYTSPTFFVSYVDINATAMVTMNNNSGIFTGFPPIATVLSGTSDQLKVAQLALYNLDNIPQRFIVYMNISSSNFNLWDGVLQPNESLFYDDGIGWYTSIPTFVPGATGVQGQTGIQGITGPYGFTGVQGQTGAQGVVIYPTGITARYYGFNGSSLSGTGGITNPQPLVFYNQDYDTNSAYNNSTGIFTAPTTGYYQVNAGISFNDNQSQFLGIQIFYNGSQWNDSMVAATAAVFLQPYYSAVIADQIHCNSGDTLAVYYVTDSGNTLTVLDGFGSFTLTGPGLQGATGIAVPVPYPLTYNGLIPTPSSGGYGYAITLYANRAFTITSLYISSRADGGSNTVALYDGSNLITTSVPIAVAPSSTYISLSYSVSVGDYLYLVYTGSTYTTDLQYTVNGS